MHFAGFCFPWKQLSLLGSHPCWLVRYSPGGTEGLLTRKKSEPQPKIIWCTQIQKRLGLDSLFSSGIILSNVSFPVGEFGKGYSWNVLWPWEPPGVWEGANWSQRPELVTQEQFIPALSVPKHFNQRKSYTYHLTWAKTLQQSVLVEG